MDNLGRNLGNANETLRPADFDTKQTKHFDTRTQQKLFGNMAEDGRMTLQEIMDETSRFELRPH